MEIHKSRPTRAGSESLIERNRSVRILAKSIYRELKSKGYDDRQIVSLATELLSEVTDEMSRESAHRPGHTPPSATGTDGEEGSPRHARQALRRASLRAD